MSKPWTQARLRAALIGSQALRPPWSLRVPASTAATLYRVERGPFWICAMGCEPVQIRPGGIVLLPSATSHIVASDDDMRDPITIADVEDIHGISGTGAPDATQLLAIVGHWQADTRPAILGLPTLLDLPMEGSTASIDRLLDICRDLVAAGPVANAFGTLIANALMVAVIEAADPESTGERLALGDAAITRALMLIQASSEPIAINDLAKAVGLARSTFIARFGEATGQPPAQYQMSLILARAADRLLASRARVGEIAREFGFNSEPAFSRAFRRQFGDAPARWRTKRQAEIY